MRDGNNERHQVPYARDKAGRRAVAGIQDRHRRERRRRFADSDQHRPPVVQVQLAALPERLARPHVLMARFIDHHGVGAPQVAQLAAKHLAWRADQVGIVESEQHDVPVVAILQPRSHLAFVQSNGPQHAGHAPHPVQIGLGQSRRLVDEPHLVVHNPDAGVAYIHNLARRAFDDADKDRDLLRHQMAGECHAHDQAPVLAAVPDQHPQRDPIHRSPSRSAWSGVPSCHMACYAAKRF